MAKKVMTLKELKALHESDANALQSLKAKNEKVIGFAMSDPEIGEDACCGQIAENSLIDRILTGKTDTNEAAEKIKLQNTQLNAALQTKWNETLAEKIGAENTAKLLEEEGLPVRMKLIQVPSLNKKGEAIVNEDGTPTTHAVLSFELIRLKVKTAGTGSVSSNLSGEKKPTPYSSFVVDGKHYATASEGIEAMRPFLSGKAGATADFKLPETSFSKPRYLANLAKQWPDANIQAVVQADRVADTVIFCTDNKVPTSTFTLGDKSVMTVALDKHYFIYVK